MRKLASLMIALCMILAAFPAMADMDYLGDMEVVNCKEWVSLRELPSTSAKRLTKALSGAKKAIHSTMRASDRDKPFDGT